MERGVNRVDEIEKTQKHEQKLRAAVPCQVVQQFAGGGDGGLFADCALPQSSLLLLQMLSCAKCFFEPR
jgi:hypothetical protein